jgi:predicted nucleotidyltransferase
MSDLNHIFSVLEALVSEGVDFIVIGGIAVILHGMPRVSEDLDLVIKMNPENIKKIRKALNSIFIDDEIREITFSELKSYSIIRYISPDDDVIDLIANLGEAFDFNNIEYLTLEIEGVKVKIATPKALINMKTNTNREKDTLDLLYLRELIKKTEN